MQFNSKEDIEAPIEAVFTAIQDFETFERGAMRRGAEVSRIDSLKNQGLGSAWAARFEMRGRRRDVEIKITHFERPSGYTASFQSQGMEGDFIIELVALSKNRTRMSISMELKPKTLSARLLVQSLKLAKTNLTKRFQMRVAEYSRDLEDRLKGGTMV